MHCLCVASCHSLRYSFHHCNCCGMHACDCLCCVLCVLRHKVILVLRWLSDNPAMLRERQLDRLQRAYHCLPGSGNGIDRRQFIIWCDTCVDVTFEVAGCLCGIPVTLCLCKERHASAWLTFCIFLWCLSSWRPSAQSTRRRQILTPHRITI